MEGRPLEDPVLVDAARNGDVAAYEALVEMYQQIAFRTAYLITRSAADAEDAAQDAFVKAYYALDRFRPGAEFRPWLLRIVGNEARNKLRSRGRREHLAVRVTALRPSGEAAPSPEEAALAGDDRAVLVEALESLSEQDRLVISLRYLVDLSEAETAEVLGLPRGTVKSRLSRAMSRLRESLGERSGSTTIEGSRS